MVIFLTSARSNFFQREVRKNTTLDLVFIIPVDFDVNKSKLWGLIQRIQDKILFWEKV